MKRPGSSLLIVVLILTIVSVLTVTGARVFLLNTQQSASLDAAARARQMAHAGLDEVMGRLNSASGVSGYGDFGIVNGSGASVSPVRQQLTGDSCSGSILPTNQTIIPICPFYDFSIHSQIIFNPSLSGDITAFNAQAFQLTDFPSDVSVNVPIQRGTGIQLTINAGASVLYDTCTNVNGTGCSGTLSGNSITLPNSTQLLQIKLHYSGLLNPLVTLLACSPDLTGFCSIGKGFTSADIVGHAGTAESHIILEEHHDASGKAIFTSRETAQNLSVYGLLQP